MTPDSVTACLDENPHAVFLLEGTRDVPEVDAERLTSFSAWLAERFPWAVFRSGNAPGSDELFALGVVQVDPSRLQLVTPTEGHRKKQRHPENYAISVGKVSLVREEKLAWHTQEATPKNKSLIEKRHRNPRLQSKARYLLRDTLKVVGDPENGLLPADVGIFYTKSDPESGGTGHTLRVCRMHHVPVYLQADWMSWQE